jgi:metal-sulfur cluster biosynthetic enzyme
MSTDHPVNHGDLPDVPEAAPAGGKTATVSEDDVTEAMKDVVDPELGINVVDLGLVYGVHVDEGSNAVIDMTLTSAACPLTDVIQDQTNSALEGLVNDVAINWVWMPPSSQPAGERANPRRRVETLGRLREWVKQDSGPPSRHSGSWPVSTPS